MYLDSSALIAILVHEGERDRMLLRISQSTRCVTSILTMFETIIALAARTGDRQNAPRQVRQLLTGLGVETVPLDERCEEPLIEAFKRYHRGSGHAAKLNLADCVSYAAAKRFGLPLLYKGNDFTHTDLA